MVVWRTYGLALPIILAMIVYVLQRKADGLVESLLVSLSLYESRHRPYAVTLSFDTVISYDLVGEALTCYVVPNVCLMSSVGGKYVSRTHRAFVCTRFA